MSRSQVDEEEIGIGDHMRIIKSETITETIKELCIKGACHLPTDVYNRLLEAISTEDSPVSKHTLEILKENVPKFLFVLKIRMIIYLQNILIQKFIIGG